jgi:hypothetical protein
VTDNEHQIDIDDDDGVLLEGGPLDEGAEAIVVGDALVTQVEAPAVVTEQELVTLFGEDENAEDLEDDDLELGEYDDVQVAALDHAFEVEEQADPRVAKLESAVQELAGAEVKREQQRVRRKVTAATGGAGLVGVVPILLQFVGAFEMSAEAASALAAGLAALGALAAGYLTPERKAPLPAEVAAEIMSGARTG